GWGSPGNPLFGYSDRFDQQFFRHLFVENLHHIGSALSAAKSVYVPYAAQENVYRWCEYQVNLLGDPEMPVWTDQPWNMVVSCPAELPTGPSLCAIYVTDGAQPLAGALVCLMQDTSVYATGMTDDTGRLSLNISPDNPAFPLQLTVTARNFVPFEGTIPLRSDKAYVQMASVTVNGSAQRLVEPNAVVKIGGYFKNFGHTLASNVNAIFSCENAAIDIQDNVESLGTMQPGDSLYRSDAFSFKTPAGLANGTVLRFRIEISDGSENVWTDILSLTVASLVLSLSDYQISDDASADGDGFAEAGETVEVTLMLQNTGLAAASAGSMTLNCNSGRLILPTAPLLFPSVAAQENQVVVFEIGIESTCPMPNFIPVHATMTTGDGQFSDTFIFAIGTFGLMDNMENGTAEWTHSGSPDLWHLNTDRKHSGHFSYHCGDKIKIVYENGMDNSLTSPPFVLDRDSQLSFWCWYQCPNYGVNGIYPQVNDGSGWENLDFIGSGGALPALPTGNDWLQYIYDLSHYPAGATLQLRFRFVSDYETVTEGVYLDDVIVGRKACKQSFFAPPKPAPVTPKAKQLDKKIWLSWETEAPSIEAFQKEGYAFQGYNVYQLHSLLPLKSTGVRIATYDIVDGVAEIVEEITDPETGQPTQIITQHGSDSGIQRTIPIDQDYIDKTHLIHGKAYYFAVTAYTYHSDSSAVPRSSESDLKLLTVVYEDRDSPFAYGDTLETDHTSGSAHGRVIPIVEDPALFKQHTYRVDFNDAGSGLAWNLSDITDNTLLLQNRTEFNGEENVPSVDGFKVIVKEPVQKDFYDLVINGSGTYDIRSYLQMNWATTARAVDAYGWGTTDTNELSKDYELRYTGAYENPDADVVRLQDGTGAMATLYEARFYELKDHPMNPNPGSNQPFAVRIPFEVWNVDDNRQVNLLIYDRIQTLPAHPFYAFNPNDRMYCFICNTPYHEAAVDLLSNEMDHLTWSLVFYKSIFNRGDVISIYYENPLSADDVYTFSTRWDTSVEDGGGVMRYELMQNFPNPFNAATRITFYLPEQQATTLTVYDIRGRKVATLLKNVKLTGKQEVVWTAHSLPSGIYFYHLQSGGFDQVLKCILLR
ncbi:T9SS type A sorting domain-containing protein, partial [candidate division KSB1 bacterium]|nr:T9SS type A sorting domain-containing protein [candidate division KSB1 bacterium]